MPYTQKLRNEFLIGSGLQYLKHGDPDTAARYLLTGIRLNARGDTYLSAPMKAAAYVLARTGMLGRVYAAFARRR
jgi:hypothetical protein